MINTYLINNDGDKWWFKNGKCHRNGNLSAVEYAYGDKCWYKNGKRHRDGDLPAIEYVNGDKFWYNNGFHHRDNDLPAIEYANGIKWWYKNNERYFPLIYPIIITINKIIEIKIGKIEDKWWYKEILN